MRSRWCYMWSTPSQEKSATSFFFFFQVYREKQWQKETTDKQGRVKIEHTEFRPAASSEALIRGVRGSGLREQPFWILLAGRRPLLSGAEGHSSCTRTAWDAFNQAGGQEWPHSYYDTCWGGEDGGEGPPETEKKSSSRQETFSLFLYKSSVFGCGHWRVSAGTGPSCLRWHCLRSVECRAWFSDKRRSKPSILPQRLKTGDRSFAHSLPP